MALLFLKPWRVEDGWSKQRPGRFTPGKDPVPIVEDASWAPGLVWTGGENLAQPLSDPWTVQLVSNRSE